MGIIDRIVQFIDYKKLSKREFYLKTNLSNGFLDKVSKIGSDKIEKILSTYPEMDIEWLVTGKGAMLKTEKSEIKALPCNLGIEGQHIPLVGVGAVGGFGSTDFSIAEQDVKAFYVVPKFKDRKIDFMIEVHGSSMYPKFNSGDVVACRIISESNFIQWNKVHVIATDEQGILIKRIKKGSENRLLAVSDNKDYDPFEIPAEEVTGLALVVGVIRLE